MPDIKIEHLEKNQVKITVTVPESEVQPHLEAAAAELSQQTKIPGFRPGKASFDVVKQRVGEMKLYETALEAIVRSTYVKALLDNNIESVGSPKIDVEKLAPANPIIYTAEVSRMPHVQELANLSKIKIEQKTPEIKDEEIETVLRDLARMQTKQVRAPKDTPATDKDQAVVKMEMKKEGVVIEGGQSTNHTIPLAEDHYIPGFKEQIIGMKEGEQKTFTLDFPKEHAIKTLAGNTIEFDVTLDQLFHLDCPTMDDAFAKSIGQENMDELKKKLYENIMNEKQQAEEGRQEKELLEAVAKKTQFDDIPDLLINEEIRKMIEELQHRVEAQGGKFEDYLGHIKKTLAQLKLELTPEALTRIKVALILRKVAQDQDIKPDEKELDDRIDTIAKQYENNKEAREHIFSPAYREYMAHTMVNRKAIDWLKDQVIAKK